MLIVRCDICQRVEETDGYYYDENPHIALTRHLTDKRDGRWEVICSSTSTGKRKEIDACPECAKRYRELLEEQEQQRKAFLGVEDTE